MFWEKLIELRETLSTNVVQYDTITLPTRTIKIALGVFLFQNFTIAMWWCIKDAVFYPVLFFISAFLQVGWFWSKVTASWKGGDVSTTVIDCSLSEPEPVEAPTISIYTAGITGGENVEVKLDIESAHNSLLELSSRSNSPIPHPLEFSEDSE